MEERKADNTFLEDTLKRVMEQSFHIKKTSLIVDMLLLTSTLGISLKLLYSLLYSFNFNSLLNIISPYKEIIDFLFIIGLITLILAIILFCWDYWRKPQPNWRIKQELKRFMFTYVFMGKNNEELKRELYIHPFIKTNRKIKLKEIRFNLNTPRFNEDIAEKLKNPFNFKYAQQVDLIEYHNKNNRQRGYILQIFYEAQDNVFNNNLERYKYE